MKYHARSVANDTVRIISVVSALSFGETPIRTEENTTIGSVLAPGPETKLAITSLPYPSKAEPEDGAMQAMQPMF